jgi:mono/diheme cytochrome c family protein
MKTLGIIFLGAVAFVLCTSMLIFTSNAASQNANSAPTNTNTQAQQDFSKNTWDLPADADKTKNPIPSSPESVQKGKDLYSARDKGNCGFCHGDTGAGNEAMMGRLRRKPADISNKERMDSMTDGELFWKISKGIQGIMPAGERKMSEEERWHVVNYIRTLVKQPAKP